MSTKTKRHEPIPPDYEVQPLKPGEPAAAHYTCCTCGLSWDDAVVTGKTPTPSGRCPFEWFHVLPDPDVRRFEIFPNGDMCSKAWDAVEYKRFGDQFGTFRGDLSHSFRGRALFRHLRKLYPGCRIRLRH